MRVNHQPPRQSHPDVGPVFCYCPDEFLQHLRLLNSEVSKPFFGDLTAFMSSGPCVVMVLEAQGAIAKWRETMGGTDPAKAADGTLRKQFGSNIERNATHGSDAPETAAEEISYFFAGIDRR